MNISVVDVDADGGAYLVESLDAGGTWIDGEHVVFFVEDDFEDVGVAADEDVGQMGVDELEGLVVVAASGPDILRYASSAPSGPRTRRAGCREPGCGPACRRSCRRLPSGA